MLKRWLLLLLAALFLFSCDIEIKLNQADIDKMVKKTVAFEQRAGKNKVELKLDKGILNINSHEGDSLKAELRRYDFAKPAEALYANGVFSVIAPRKEKELRHWNINIPTGKSTDIELECNTGDINMNLTDVDVKKLDLFCAVGSVNLALGNLNSDDVFITIQNSVGNINVTLPAETGVQLTAKGSVLRLAAPDFEEQGEAMVNESYGKSLSTIYLDITCETGNVTINQN